MAKNVYQDSPFGIAVFPHLNKPDSKFNPDHPLFKVKLRLEGASAQALKEKVDAAADAAFADYFENGEGKMMTPAERKKLSVYRPYVEEEDDEGHPTGAILFEFKQNATIKLKDGTVKTIEIGLYDAAGNPMHKIVRGGSEIRVNYSMRPIPMKSLKQVGVRLDFGRVQVRKLAEGNGGGGFGAVEGYVDDGADGFGSAGGDATADGNADY